MDRSEGMYEGLRDELDAAYAAAVWDGERIDRIADAMIRLEYGSRRPPAPSAPRVEECTGEATERDGYRVVPIAEQDVHGWKAGILLCSDEPRGDRAAKSLAGRVFDSREAALSFARSEFGALDPD